MKHWKGIVEIAAIFAVFIASICASTHLLNHQFTTDEVRVRGFYLEPENSLDMVIIGSSAVYTTFNSSIAWKEEGFTSYALATSGAPMGIAKSMVKEVLKTQKPKLVLIDLNGVLYNDEMEQREGMTRIWIDNMPFSQNKIDTIRELRGDENILSWCMPLYTYHDNWEKILSCIRYTNYEWKMRLGNRLPYSFSMRTITGKSKRDKLIDVRNYQDKQELYPLSGQRFTDLLNYLKENNINAAFFNMPRYYDEKMLEQRRLLNEAIDLATKEGFRVYDFDKEIDQMNLDPNKDYYNAGHLNMDGQVKATKYIAHRINQDYQLSKGKHSENIEIRWNEEYEAYKKIFAYYQENMKKGIREEITVDIIDKILSKEEGATQ